MSILSDDELSLIIERVTDKYDIKSFSEVCKQWLRVEGMTRFSIRVIESELIPGFIPRYPNLISFSAPCLISDSHIEFVAKNCPKLQIFNLNLSETLEEINEISADFYYEDVGNDGIIALAKGCPNLTEVFLRMRTNVASVAVVSLAKFCPNLTILDLSMCNLVDDQALEAISCLNSIRVLSLENCSLITDHGVTFLATGHISKTLKELVLAGCTRITDSGGLAVASLASIEILDLFWLINITDVTVVAIAENCVNLAAIGLTGCQITGVSVRAFENHGSLEYLEMTSCFNFCMDDLRIVIRAPALNDIVLDKRLRSRIPKEIRAHINEVWCQLHWR